MSQQFTTKHFIADGPQSQDGRTVKGVTPKFYIKDAGTTYTTGEEYNGLWSQGSIFNPSGYADVGHWRFLERRNRVAFNARSRGNNDIMMDGIKWSTDSIGTYVEFKLPDNEPLPIANTNYWMMIGTGGGLNEQLQWGSFLTEPGFNNLLSVGGSRKLRYQFDIWVYLREPPGSGQTQTLLHLVDPSQGSKLRFCIEGGTNPTLAIYVAGDASGVKSQAAASRMYPNGSQEGGLHHIGFILDVDQLSSGNPIFSDPSAESPEGFYVDGVFFERDQGNTSSWSTSAESIGFNGFVCCEVNNSTLNADKEAGSPNFHNHFTGKVYAVQLNTIGQVGTITKKRMNTLYNLKFNIPRGPSYIDLSDKFEYGGRNLLKEIGDIEQVVDSEDGNFYVTIQNLRAKN